MEINETSIINAIHQFYSTDDQNLRRQLNEWLTNVQNSPDVWRFAWNLLRSENTDDKLIQYFAANCLYQKLSGGKMDEYLTRYGKNSENAEATDRFLRDSLLEAISRIPSNLVKSKLTSVLAAYVVYSTPDIWPDSFENLVTYWKTTQPILLLDIFGLIPIECGAMTMGIERKSAVRNVLRTRERFVAEIASDLLRQYRTNSEIVDAAVRCVESWVDFCKDAGEWVAIVALCLHCATDVGGPTMSAVSKFFCRFVENSDLRKLENFIGQLFDYLAPLLLRGPINGDEEQFEDITEMCLALIENQTSFILKNIKINNSVQILIEAALKLTNSPGVYFVDEIYSAKTFTFWYNLYEDTAAEQDSTIRSILLTHIEPIYLRLGDILLNKLKYPSSTINYTAEAKETFERYRSEGGEIFVYCYRILANNSTENKFLDLLIGQRFKDAFDRLTTTTNWEECDVILFALESIGDYVASDHVGLRNFLEHDLTKIPFSNSMIANTCLKMIHKYGHVIGDDERLLKPILMEIILKFVNESTTVYNSTLALESLTRNGDLILAKDENLCALIISASLSCFYDPRFTRADQLRALSSIGYVLATQSNEIILRHLNEFLAPRLQRLQNVVDERTTACTKEELLMEFDILTCLISALGSGISRRTNNNMDQIGIDGLGNPVYLIIEQSFTLFENLYAASGGDVDVATKIVDILKRALSTLGEETKNLLPQFCRILTILFPPHARAITLMKPLFLLFANNDDDVSEMTMISIFNGLSEKLIVYDNEEAVEEFLGLCHQLVKKQWNFSIKYENHLDFDGAIRIACRTIGNGTSESPTIRQASQFLCEFLTHTDSIKVGQMVEKYGSILLTACFERLKSELLTSCVEYVADVVLNLMKFNQQNIDRWTQHENLVSVVSNPLITAMLKEVGNKRKFREYAKKYNITCRKGMRTV